MMKEFIKAIQEDKAYGWIANHGHELSKDDLCNIIKEYEYARTMTDVEDLFKDHIVENLEDLYGEDD